MPPGSVARVSDNPEEFTVTVTLPVDELDGLLESVPFTTIVELPVVVGVPLMTQLAPRVSPAGKVPLTNWQL